MRRNLYPVSGEESEGEAVNNTILIGDVLEKLKEIPDKHINTCVTSPPYWGLRDYGAAGQIGLEKTPEEYVDKMVQVFREVRRVLRDDGTLWLNLGDSYAQKGGKQMSDEEFQKFQKRAIEKNYNVGGWGASKKRGQGASGRAVNTAVSGLKTKDLVGIPWMVAFALRADGWYLRQDIIWHKPNPMPESVKDRCTKAHEYIFLLSKSQKYYYDYEAIKEPGKDWGHRERQNSSWVENNVNMGSAQSMLKKPNDCNYSETGRNKRSVWTVTTKPFSGAHFATFPPDLIEPCILAGSPKGGIVLDPFFGAGTTGIVSMKNGRNYIGIELNPEYAEMAENRIKYGTVDPKEIESEKKQGVLF